ncbi:MAG: hypothetical protein PUP93_27960 [Rhizonema sp. NSF051]|nr:hypothetical protein [Rhizonema sp. NSF051]
MTSYQANKVRSEYSKSVYDVTTLLGVINDSIKNYFVLSEQNRVLMCGILTLAVVVKHGFDQYFEESDIDKATVED